MLFEPSESQKRFMKMIEEMNKTTIKYIEWDIDYRPFIKHNIKRTINMKLENGIWIKK